MKITLTRKKIVLISFVVILLLIVIKVGHFFYQEDIRWHGRDFATREKMCFQFAVDYLNNIEKDPNFTEDKRKLAIDIETEIVDLCQLEFSKEAAGSYAPNALEKYR